MTFPGLAGASRACGCPASRPLDPAFAGSVFVEATRETESAAPFFGVFQPFSNPLESKRFRVSNETRAKGDPMQAQRSGSRGERRRPAAQPKKKQPLSERLLFLSRAEGSPPLELLAGLEPATC